MIEALVVLGFLIWVIMMVVIGIWSIVLDYKYSKYNGNLNDYLIYDYVPMLWLIFTLIWPMGLLFCIGVIFINNPPFERLTIFIIKKFYKDKSELTWKHNKHDSVMGSIINTSNDDNGLTVCVRCKDKKTYNQLVKDKDIYGSINNKL